MRRWDDRGELVVERIIGANGFKCDRVLTTQIDGAPLAAQTDKCGTIEETGGINIRAGSGQEASFQGEVSIQTTAQIFNAFETQTVGVVSASRVHRGTAIAIGILVLLVADTRVKRTVNRHAGLCLCNACKCTQDCQCEKRFFH